MGLKKTTIGLGIILASVSLYAEPGGNEGDKGDSVKLYQIGKAGYYCLSITRDESGCISGTNEDGTPVNVLDFLKGRKVTFENLSDAPHDMKFSGNNAEEIPPQAPQGEVVGKQMNAVDNNTAKITCSFHGDQLGVGYKVPEAKPVEELNAGHIQRGGLPEEAFAEKAPGATGTLAEGARPTRRTGLADVSEKVLSRAESQDVARLIANRPDLMGKLKEVRPLLATELSANENLKKILSASPKTGSTAGGKRESTDGSAGGLGGRNGFSRAAIAKSAYPVQANAVVDTNQMGIRDSKDLGRVKTYNLAQRMDPETNARVQHLLGKGTSQGNKAQVSVPNNHRALASLNGGEFGPASGSVSSQGKGIHTFEMSPLGWAAVSGMILILLLKRRKRSSN